MNDRTSNRRLWEALGLLTCLAAAMLMFPPQTVRIPDQNRTVTSRAKVDESARIAEILRTASERALPTCDWADQESQQKISEQIKPLDDFFADVKTRTPRFAEEVLGWKSKWKFVVDKVPFTKGGRHAEFLRQAFEKHLFASADLTRATGQVSQGYSDVLAAIENQMLMRIRADLQDLPPACLPAFANQTRLETAFQAAVAQTMEHVGKEVQADVGTLLVSVVTEEVLTGVAIRLGVSAGVLGAGVGSSWATLGVGVVVSLIVDQIISWVWDWWTDPRGTLVDDLNAKLDQLHRLLVEGDEKTPGLRSGLEEFARQRATVRRQALAAMFQPLPGLSAK